jgi:excinuclease ABC subunit A
MRNKYIHIKGARQNNLKNLNLDIPLNHFTAVTGVSGSGKSSLAFDTLYAEGQRRYVETFSPYARQFMDRMDRPHVEIIEGIPPAIAIDRKDPVRTSRSTVGTMTELTDYIKLLFVRFACLHCEICGDTVTPETPEMIWKKIVKYSENRKMVITFPYHLRNILPSVIKNELLRSGFDRIFFNNRIEELSISLLEQSEKTIDVVADRVVFQNKDRKRIMDSLESAFRFGGGRLDIWGMDDLHMSFSEILECGKCHITYTAPTSNLFSYNSPAGACGVCRGFGRTIDIDLNLIIPDERLTLEEGAVRPWGTWETEKPEYEDLVNFCRKNMIPTDVQFKQLSKEQQRSIIEGTPDYYGIRGFFRWLETKTYKMPVRVYLSRYRSYDLCPECQGTRFKKETLLYRLKGQTIAEIYSQSVNWALAFFDDISIPQEDKPGLMVLDAVRSRLKFLKDVGLGYLTMDRQSRTLSGGEVQRVSLAAALGSSLVNTLYILDEPSIGLHPSDTHRLIKILHNLRDLSNTLVVVEHDPDIISQSDYLLDLGPGAGEKGGEMMYFGPTSEVNSSLTGKYLKGEIILSIPEYRKIPQKDKWITIRGASENNLKNIDASIPLGLFVCLTGVSGSGKSTLAEDILYRAIKYYKRDPQGKPGKHESITGLDDISDVILVDQHPIGRTPRANLSTYTKALDHIRKLLSKTPAAKQRKFDAGYFSFNVAKGRCETCKGDGFEKIEMQFLSDVYITCPECAGRRFKPEVLEVYYNNKNIHDILQMTVDEALIFFENHDLIYSSLVPLTWVGLGYIRLGQAISTFSGGEAQRLKLSRYLKMGQLNKLLFIFDEPTTGLHFDDIGKLLEAFKKLVTDGHTLLVIEHNMEMIKTADWIIDIGPEGGDNGGYIVASGTPEEIAANPESTTGRYLSKVLTRKSRLEHKPPSSKIAESESFYSNSIIVQGAREHNLKNITVSLPRNQLVVLTGVSGSGKSTLAFDIVFAEGQRRYLESLAPYVRQYIKILEKPDVDLVVGISPTVAIEQRISHTSRRSTVATLTEIYHFLRLLYSKLGERYCTGCGSLLLAKTPEVITAGIRSRYRNRSATILSTKISGRKGFHKDLLNRLAGEGFTNARIDEQWVALKKDIRLSRYHEHTIQLVIGEIQNGIAVLANTKNNIGVDLQNLIEIALAHGDGAFILMDKNNKQEIFSTRGICSNCGIGVKALDPRLFSFNSSQGACHTCNGLGVIDIEDNEEDSIFSETGFIGNTCPACEGSRLNPDALSVKIGGFSIWDLMNVPSEKALSIIRKFSFSSAQLPIAEPVISEILKRLSLLNKLGLTYLALGRSGNTLSGGEAQRVRLAAQLGSNLTGVCYILDEPTIGLHPRDNHILIDALKLLRDRGNTILVVEHDEDTIRAADTIIDMGPGAGEQGGIVVASGNLTQLKKVPESVTGAMFNGRDRKISSRFRDYKKVSSIMVKGASSNNLKHIDVRFPLGVFTCITGVSGSGKSTLLKETLYKGLKKRLLKKTEYEGCIQGIEGWKNISRALEVDHSPIGRTPRSIPASYIGFLTQIRHLFAGTPEARSRGYLPGRFSFNVKGGRCEPCKGHGSIKTTMSFLPDVYVRCETCEGRRFNAETLDVYYKGKTIADVLDLTFEEAAAFFESIPVIRKAMKFVCDIGLGYLKLGQPSPTLSGGEAQRIKLASELGYPGKGPTFFILDEPTTGLHLFDIKKLLNVFQALVEAGNTVAVIEHNLEVVKEADYIIDLGPEGGDGGGYLVVTGSPGELIQNAMKSNTARFLKKYVTD